jgi:23S rRNA (cytidine2498-2'-O)-methyltransferase
VSSVSCLIAYCRPGFENELAAELSEASKRVRLSGFIRAQAHSGYVLFQLQQVLSNPGLLRSLDVDSLVFARQLILASDRIDNLAPKDRVAPLSRTLLSFALPVADVFMETADTDEGKALSRLGRQLRPHLVRELEGRHMLDARQAEHRAHVFLLSSRSAHVGLSPLDRGPHAPMGIMRLKMPAGAPSRSTLKLDEAIRVLLSQQQRKALFKEGMRAVDLGAAPGGWTYQLVRRGLFVQAVDNASLDEKLAKSDLVEHIRADGFHFRPREPVDWLVCDMVEKPSRIARLVSDWLADGLCRQCLFNLKLPMKKRRDELLSCTSLIERRLAGAGQKLQLRFKQLYHDRDEVTGFARLSP